MVKDRPAIELKKEKIKKYMEYAVDLKTITPEEGIRPNLFDIG